MSPLKIIIKKPQKSQIERRVLSAQNSPNRDLGLNTVINHLLSGLVQSG